MFVENDEAETKEIKTSGFVRQIIMVEQKRVELPADTLYEAILNGDYDTFNKLIESNRSKINEGRLSQIFEICFWGQRALVSTGTGQTKPHIWVAVEEAIKYGDSKSAEGQRQYQTREIILKLMLARGGLMSPNPQPDVDKYGQKIEWLPLRKKVLECRTRNTMSRCISWLCCGFCCCGYRCTKTFDICGGLQHYAAQKNSVPVLRVLNDWGFDMRAPDEDGWSPIMYARDAGAQEAVAFLCDECKIAGPDSHESCV